MSALDTALAKQDSSRPPQKAHRISKRLRKALELIADGTPTITAAAEAAGMSRSALDQALRKQHVQDELRSIVKSRMPVRGAQAVAKIAHLSNEARSDYVQLEASKAIADRAGYVTDQGLSGVGGGLSININIGGDAQITTDT